MNLAIFSIFEFVQLSISTKQLPQKYCGCCRWLGVSRLYPKQPLLEVIICSEVGRGPIESQNRSGTGETSTDEQHVKQIKDFLLN